jgi:hypothetical protein
MGLTNSSYLHYGYWEPLPTVGEELTLTRLRVARRCIYSQTFEFYRRRDKNCTLSRKESSFDRKVIIGQSFKRCYPGAIADYPTFWNLPIIMATPWAVIVVLSNNLKDKYLT